MEPFHSPFRTKLLLFTNNIKNNNNINRSSTDDGLILKNNNLIRRKSSRTLFWQFLAAVTYVILNISTFDCLAATKQEGKLFWKNRIKNIYNLIKNDSRGFISVIFFKNKVLISLDFIY